MKGVSLKKLVESHGPAAVVEEIVPLLWTDDQRERLRPEDFSIRELWEAMVGPVESTLAQAMASSRPGFHSTPLVEAQQSTAFSIVTGNIIAAQIQQAYDDHPGVLDQLVERYGSSQRTERFAGFQSFGGIETVPEGKPYPETGFFDKGVEGPEPDKRGVAITLTDETVLYDKTGQVLGKARDIGRGMKKDREKHGIHAIEDLSATYYCFFPLVDGVPTRTALYRAAAAGAEWYNKTVNSASITLQDWTDIDEAAALFGAMTDEAGEPIYVEGSVLLVPRALVATALRIIGATSLETTPAFTAGTHTQYTTVTPNIVQALANVGGMPKPVTSPYMSSATTWYFGDPKSQFVEQEIWPVQTVELPPDQRKDILTGFRARRKSRVYARADNHFLKLT